MGFLNGYVPSNEFVKCFNEDARGFSHKVTYLPEKNCYFFSALTSKCGIIQVYGSCMKEIEENFIKEVQKRLKGNKKNFFKKLWRVNAMFYKVERKYRDWADQVSWRRFPHPLEVARNIEKIRKVMVDILLDAHFGND